MKTKGFTLLELMVVVVVLAVLVVAMGPVLHHAVEDARTTMCLNNQATITRGLSQYVTVWHMYPMNYRTTPYAAWNQYPSRNSLDALSKYVGGPAGRTDTSVTPNRILESDLQSNMDPLHPTTFADFPRVYVCPSADKQALYSSAPNTVANPNPNLHSWYHASYWVNPAVRSNRGFNTYSQLAGSGTRSGDMPGAITGYSSFFTVCRNYADGHGQLVGHWKNVYMPRPETVGDLHSTVFCGDTNNVIEHPLADGSMDSPNKGFWDFIPRWGEAIGAMGFERHGGMVIGYMDGHARKMLRAELNSTTDAGVRGAHSDPPGQLLPGVPAPSH